MVRLTQISTLVHCAGEAVLRATLVPCGRRVVAHIVDRDVKITVGSERSNDPVVKELVERAIDTQRILMEAKPDHMF